jgi:phosphoenolpyruvate synthase/pyruvate phosphate dikinase
MLVTKHSTHFFAKNESGGKGFNLYLMTKANIPVPEWVVFGRRYFQDFIQSSGIQQELHQLVDKFLSKQATAKEN